MRHVKFDGGGVTKLSVAYLYKNILGCPLHKNWEYPAQASKEALSAIQFCIFIILKETVAGPN